MVRRVKLKKQNDTLNTGILYFIGLIEYVYNRFIQSNKPMALLKYIGSVINLANSFSQATRPKYVGQMSELIQQFRDECDSHEVDDWEKFYDGDDKIDAAADKIWECVLDMKENLNELTKEDVRAWTKDLIINKTHSGLQIQLDVLKLCADGQSYRLANVEEEAKGIDGFIGDEPVSIKPNTYKKTINAGKETIPYRIIYYTNGSKGVKIV